VPNTLHNKRQIWSRCHLSELFHIDAIYFARLEVQAQVDCNLPSTQEEHPAPPVVMDTKQPVLVQTTGGQPLTQLVTIGSIMPFRVLISSDAKLSMMSLQVFSSLQIPISSLTPASPIRGTSGDVVETHGSIVLPAALGATEGFQTFIGPRAVGSMILP
jgi:hypothetical protein